MRLARFLLLPFLLAAGLLMPATAEAATHEVAIAQYAYGPATLTVRVGDAVSWTNNDEVSHDVVAAGGPAAFRSPLLGTGQSWSFRFTEPGTYSYYCSVHPNMTAQIVVLPAAQQPKPAPPAPAPAKAAPAKPNTSASQPVPTSAPAVQPTTVPPTASATTSAPSSAAVVSPTAGDAAPRRLDPLLPVAGVVVGVATLCLLLIGRRREQ